MKKVIVKLNSIKLNKHGKHLKTIKIIICTNHFKWVVCLSIRNLTQNKLTLVKEKHFFKIKLI